MIRRTFSITKHRPGVKRPMARKPPGVNRKGLRVLKALKKSEDKSHK